MRDDRWRPQDELLDSVMDKCVDDAYRGAADDGGGSPVLVAGGLVLAVLGLIVGAGTGNPLLAFGIVVGLAAAGLGYVAVSQSPVRVNRLSILDPIGGPGNLPAGYLVHPKAWQAGMREYVAVVTDRQLRVAVRLCREHPGAVSDVIRLVMRAEKHAAQHGADHEITEHDVFRVASRWTAEHARNAPTMTLPAVR
ncbi:hypothetical protein [Actinoplanes sp. DH11]|uniref:hypothetical protein n=1 Tax=Actinoplanes sp. DH11 TaxID=2857011 RepID=UPI001E5875BD|nr:hypothetical protein [Actinoplanes sp. DH11]